jgi:hypothetical protein
MGMIPFWRFTSDSDIITPQETAGPGFGGNNVKNPIASKVWKSGTSFVNKVISGNHGSAVSVSAFALWNHDIDTANDIVTFKLADDALMSVGVVNVPLTLRDLFLFETFTPVVKQYWQLIITVTSASLQRSIGRLAVGSHRELETSLRTPGDSFGVGNSTQRSIRTEGGQLHGDVGASLDVLRGRISGLGRDDRDELEDLKKSYQGVMPFFCFADWNNNKDLSLYGTLNNLSPATSVAPDQYAFYWTMTEQK